MSNSSYMIVLYIYMLIRNKVNRQIEHLFLYCFCISHISFSGVFICDTSPFTVSHLTQVISLFPHWVPLHLPIDSCPLVMSAFVNR